MKDERFVILDALRGFAGLVVPLFHVCECLSHHPTRYELFCGHGYLAVEFFLLLMGYMLSYAYDSRFVNGMSIGRFFLMRLRRLHPLVISGVAMGLAVALVQCCVGADWIPWLKGCAPLQVFFLALWAMTMVPVIGVGVINPFNACSWTLYYEYLANALYALFLRRVGTLALGLCAFVSLVFWVCYGFHVNINGVLGTHFQLFDDVAALRRWTIACGWGDSPVQFYGGCVRLALPLFIGLLLARMNWRIRLGKGALWIALVVFAAVLFTPFSYRLGGPDHCWINSIFELVVVVVVFPALIMVGVGNHVEADSKLAQMFSFLAELSYPLYMSHYMFIGLLSSWLTCCSASCSRGTITLVSVAFYVGFVVVACLVMRFWDRPIQKRLKTAFALNVVSCKSAKEK